MFTKQQLPVIHNIRKTPIWSTIQDIYPNDTFFETLTMFFTLSHAMELNGLQDGVLSKKFAVLIHVSNVFKSYLKNKL